MPLDFNENEPTPEQQFAQLWEHLSEADRLALSRNIMACALPARISGGLMRSFAARLIFTVITAIFLFFIVYLAPTMPRQMTVAGIILGSALTIIVIFMWLSGSGKPPQ